MPTAPCLRSDALMDSESLAKVASIHRIGFRLGSTTDRAVEPT